MELPFNHKNYFNFEEFNENDSLKNFILNERREELISKRKEFIQNYRKKQRLLSLLVDNNQNNNINNMNNYLNFENIQLEPDPISRIVLLRYWLRANSSKIDINFINKHLALIKCFLFDFKKILFDYKNDNIESHIIINIEILCCYLYLLFEPELNPLIDEFDFDLLFNINTFCFYYLNNDKNFYKKENLKSLHLYILFFLNNLIRILPDVELIKSTIDIHNCIFLIYNKYFNVINNYGTNNNNKIQYENNNISVNLNKCDDSEFFVFVFLKLIENCILFLNLKENDRKELVGILLNLIYYYFYNNMNKLLIYSLETLIITKEAYILLEKENYNTFLIFVIDKIIFNFNYKNQSDVTLIINKLFFELYLQHIIFLIEYTLMIKPNINYALCLNEKIIIFIKNYYFQFYQSLLTGNKREININELKVISKLTKILNVFFRIRNETNLGFLNSEQKNDFQNILCSCFISKNNNGDSLYDIIINIFILLVEIKEKHPKKICNLIIDIFKNIYPLKKLEYQKDIIYIKGFQVFLIENYSLHLKLFSFLNMEKYSFLAEHMLDLISAILFFCEQIDINEKEENYFFYKIKKELYTINVFEEIENIECNFVNNNLKILAHQICDNYLIQDY